MSHLREYLEQSGVIGPQQMEAAVRRQQIYGGSLDSAILELELIDAASLDELLTLACGLPSVPSRLLRPHLPRPWNTVAAPLVATGWVVPLAVEHGEVLVAVHPDLADDKLGALYRTTRGAKPMVTAECCIARMAAEQNNQIVPQRFAVMAAQYLQALAKRQEIAPTVLADTPASPTTSLRTIIEPLPPPPPMASTPASTGNPPGSGAVRLPVDADALRRRLTPQLNELASARERDTATNAVISAAMIVTPRVALFGIKHDGLLGLHAGGSRIQNIDGTRIPIQTGGQIERAIASDIEVDRVTDLDLRMAVEQERAVPCVLAPIRVRSRPVLLLYADRNGEPFDAAEIDALREVCRTAEHALEEVLRIRRSAKSNEADKPAPNPVLGLPTSKVAPNMQAPASVSPIPLTHAIPPVRARTSNTQSGPRPSTADVHMPTLVGQTSQAHDPSPRTKSSTIPFSPATIPGMAPAPHGSTHTPTSTLEAHKAPLLTVNAMPPPPPLPPPPTGPQFSLPVDAGPRFVPPPVSNHSGESGLAPVVTASARGRIELDEEDRARSADAGQDRIDAVIEEIIATEASAHKLRAFGNTGLVRLASRFPGPLELIRRDLNALPPPSAHGPLVRVAIAVGEPMVPLLLELMDHPNPDIRFYAAFVFQEIRDDRCVAPLSEQAFDPHGDVRVISMRVLETYARSPVFPNALTTVRRELASKNRSRQLYGARAVGTLRDVQAIGSLIELLASHDRFIQESALESLCSITGQQLGLKPHRWKSWFDQHGTEHRVQWIIESLHHKEVSVRRWAADELIRITGRRVPFPAGGERRERERAVQSWLEWWEDEGHTVMKLPG